MPSVDDRPKRLASEIVFAGRKATVRRDRLELPSGRETFWEIIETPGAVGILPFVDHNHIILLRQYRYAVSREIYEIPAGTLEIDEEPGACALRELEEETGHRATRIVPLTQCFSSPGMLTERMFLFAAHELTVTQANLEDGECLTSEIIEWRRAIDMVLNGEIEDGKTICAILCAAQMNLRERMEND